MKGKVTMALVCARPMAGKSKRRIFNDIFFNVIFSYFLNTIIGVWQALKMISESRGEVTETRETEERVLDTREGLRDPMFPTKLMVGAEGEEEAEVDDAPAATDAEAMAWRASLLGETIPEGEALMVLVGEE